MVLHEDPHDTFRFANDRVIPRFHLDGLHCDPRSGAVQPIRGRFRCKSLTAKPRIRCDPAVQSISEEVGRVVPGSFRFIRHPPHPVK
jgi:hypothetical protein